MTYRIDPQRPFGSQGRVAPVHGMRPASVAGEAYYLIRRGALAHNLGPAFATSLELLARNESGARLGLPAGDFNIIDRRRRLITAWGAFQWNRGAIRRLEMGPGWFPWGLHENTSYQDAWPVGRLIRSISPEEEVGWPINTYATIWRDCRNEGGTPLHCARAIHLWHMGPLYLKQLRAVARRIGWDRAWLRVHWTKRQRIDGRFKGRTL